LSDLCRLRCQNGANATKVVKSSWLSVECGCADVFKVIVNC